MSFFYLSFFQINAIIVGNSAPKLIYRIQFKRDQRLYFSQDPLVRFNEGDYVIVEADRGEDLGFISAQLKHTAHFAEKEKVESNKILRVATDEEVRALPAKLIEENKALVFIRNKIKIQDYDMEVHDAEFQFDCHKLTFFYRSDRRIDFRELVTSLFAQFKTRIWMQRTNDVKKTDAFINVVKKVEPSVDVFSSTEFTMVNQQKTVQSVNDIYSPTLTISRKQHLSWRPTTLKSTDQRSRASSYDTHPTLSTATELDHLSDVYDDCDEDDATAGSNSFEMDFSSLAQLSIKDNKVASQLLSVSKPAYPPEFSLSSPRPTTAAQIYDKAVVRDDHNFELQPAGVLYLNDDLVDKYFESQANENEVDPINTPVDLQDFNFDDVFNSDYDSFTEWSKEILSGY